MTGRSTARRPDARRGRVPAVLVLALALVPVSSPRVHADEATTCAEPVAEYRYEPESFVYSLSIDLSGCDWWAGSSIALSASASRLDATGEEGAVTGTLCFSATPSGGPPPRATRCEVSVALEHLPLEVARYRGEVTYPWQDGERSQAVELDCTSIPGLTSLSGCGEAALPFG